jgi:hypothetical protein
MSTEFWWGDLLESSHLTDTGKWKDNIKTDVTKIQVSLYLYANDRIINRTEKVYFEKTQISKVFSMPCLIHIF